MAALAEVLMAGRDVAKDVSWQIRCGKTQNLEFARMSRAVRLTVILSAKLEADPELEGFRARKRAERGTVSSGGTGALTPAGAARAAARAERDEEAWDRETPDGEDCELDELERDLADRRPVVEILEEACKLMGRKVDLSAFGGGGPAKARPAAKLAPAPAPAPTPAEVVLTPEERAAICAQFEAYWDRSEALGKARRKPPDG